ncbi:hypothetical protein [Micromonospora sp. KC606]|uniref:hypothetical protein n=1 Tax=Micromonospora sp. KC606 TaxID=2530379 RepID=UPI001FB766CF|nr:hypothetical protein [Micromonospora sp. KC606]
MEIGEIHHLGANIPRELFHHPVAHDAADPVVTDAGHHDDETERLWPVCVHCGSLIGHASHAAG